MKNFLIGANVVIAILCSVALLFTLMAFTSNHSAQIIINIQNYVGNGIIIVATVIILSSQLFFLNIKYLGHNSEK